MNCKEGDLAVVISSLCGNEGRICTCIELVNPLDFRLHADEGPTWIIDRPMNAIYDDGEIVFNEDNLIPDKRLRPIRNEPGADETLTWCDVPQGVAA